jgi:hypothetical protein
MDRLAVEAAYTALNAWVDHHELAVQAGNDARFPMLEVPNRPRVMGWRTLYIHPNPQPGGLREGTNHRRIIGTVERDGVTTTVGRLTDDHGAWLQCSGCAYVGVPLEWLDGAYVCRICRRNCQWRNPENRRDRCDRAVGGNFVLCPDHGERIVCAGTCGEMYNPISLEALDGRLMCYDCRIRMCQECGEIPAGGAMLVFNPVAELNLCPDCNRRYRDEDREEQFDPDEMEPEELMIPGHDHRPVRIASIEMEIAEGGRPIVRDLAAAGLSDVPDIQGYHHGGRTGAFCYMERDASLGDTGGELIFDRLKLDDAEEVRNLHRAIRVVRQHVNEGDARMDMRCGLHIHVDAHQFGVPHVRNLALIFNYLEDPLFRLSAAKYMRHRGMNYAAKLGKRGFENDLAFGLHFLNQNGHGHALHVGNYWAAVRNQCRCGAAVIGAHEQCTCNLGKCTFEFRVYNGTTNYRKIHAYTALSQSMVAFARAHNALKLTDYPPMDYEPRGAVTTARKSDWFDRLRWMFANLYFSEGERKSLMYVIENCQLKEIGAGSLDALRHVQYDGREAAKVEVVHRNLRNMQDERARLHIDDEMYYEDDDPDPLDYDEF